MGRYQDELHGDDVSSSGRRERMVEGWSHQAPGFISPLRQRACRPGTNSVDSFAHATSSTWRIANRAPGPLPLHTIEFLTCGSSHRAQNMVHSSTRSCVAS